MGEDPSKGFILKYGSICLSILALCMSAYTFWRTQFYDPDVQFTTGESLSLGHASQGNGQLLLPVAAMNPGSKPQIVERLALRVTAPSGSGSYRFAPYAYQRIQENGNPVRESMPEPILVQGNGMALKYVWFVSSQQKPFRFSQPGVYRAQILSWTRGSSEPAVSRPFEFRVDSAMVERIRPDDDRLTPVVLQRYQRWMVGPETD